MRSRTMSFTLILAGLALAAPALAAPCACGTAKTGQAGGHHQGHHSGSAVAPASAEAAPSGSAVSGAWTAVMTDYEAIHDALAADSAEGITAAATRMAAAAEQAAAGAATAEEAVELRALAEAARGLTGNDLEALRAEFRMLSRQFGSSIARVRAQGVDLYYCSMAEGYWVQRGEIANPYYGKEMSRCGERVGAVAPAGK